MKAFLTSYHKQVFIILVAWMIALLYSAEFILSLSMISMILLSLLERRGGKLTFRGGWKETARIVKKDKSWIYATIPFFLVLFTWIYSSDMDYSLERLRIKLPFLILPLAFVRMPRLTERMYQNIHYIFLVLVSITSLGVLVNYLFHFEEINLLISQGQSLPVPTNHIRFSLMVAFAVLVGFFLFRRKYAFRFAWEKWLILGMSLFLLAFIHILSVRSGLVVFYIAMFILLLRFIFQTKRFLLGFGMLFLLTAMPILAYFLVPSLESKVNYMKWDIQQYMEGKKTGNSDSERLLSFQIGYSIVKENPILGVGAGDARPVLIEKYKELMPELQEESYKNPHNQYFFVVLGTGLLGLCFFLWGIISPLFLQQRFKDPLFLSFIIIMLLSFMVENTIENAVGIGLFTLFVMLGMNRLIRKH
ncbi:MAG: O-antigen ligase family protein [Saprospiraceae bacterium]